jgi:hypothetical protein
LLIGQENFKGSRNRNSHGKRYLLPDSISVSSDSVSFIFFFLVLARSG